MAGRSKASDFLRAMNPDPEPVAEIASVLPAQPTVAAKPKGGTRAGLKHIGAYLDKETVEKVAVLRARLELDNSELIKLAIDDLHRKHSAKRAFGDA